MNDENKLLHPTYPDRDVHPLERHDAISFANRLLQDNGMADFEAYDAYSDTTIETKGYYICSYRNISHPDWTYGGGASLIVRKADGLCGMLHCMSDWLNPNSEALASQIDVAFKEFDETSGHTT